MALDRKPDNREKKPKNNLWVTLIITAAVILVISLVYNGILHSLQKEVDYNHFLTAMNGKDLKEVELQYDRIVYTLKSEEKKSPTPIYYTGLPSGGDVMKLADELASNKVTVKQVIVEDNSTIIMILFYTIMFGLSFLLISRMTKRRGGGMMGEVGASKAKLYMEKQTGVTFKDVAGQDEAKESL